MEKIETDSYIYYFYNGLPDYVMDYEPGLKTSDDILTMLVIKYGGTIETKRREMKEND